MILRGVFASFSLLALTLLTISPVLAQEERPNPDQVCSVIIDVIADNQPIQNDGENNVTISGDINNLSDNQTAIISQYFDISPTIVQECLQENEEENTDGEDGNEEDENTDGDDNDTTENDDNDADADDGDNSENDGSGNGNNADERDARDDVIQKTIPNKTLPNTGGVNAGVYAGVGTFILFAASLIWISRFRSL